MKALLKLSHFILFFAAVVCLTTACSNAIPTISQLFNFTSPPTKDGASSWIVTTNSKTSAITVAGQCDTHAQDLEYSLDNGATWIRVSTISGADSNCKDSSFSFAVSNPFTSGSSSQAPMLLRNVYGTGTGDNANVALTYVSQYATNVRIVSGGVAKGALTPANHYVVSLRVLGVGHPQ